jgi:hypothetical protein
LVGEQPLIRWTCCREPEGGNMLDPDLLDALPDTIRIHKSDGTVVEGLRAQVSANSIIVADGSVIIEFGDVAERIASNGLHDYFEVSDPGFFEDVAGLGSHYQMKVRRIAASDFQKKHPSSASKPGAKSDQPTPIAPDTNQVNYDVFICHASEDKEALARPLYNALKAEGLSVWFDEVVLEIGDSLRRKIDDDLARCRFGVVILSPHFFAKEWPQRELDALFARETVSGEKAILPIWHNLDEATVGKLSSMLAGRLAARSEQGIPAVITQILRVVRKS